MDILKNYINTQSNYRIALFLLAFSLPIYRIASSIPFIIITVLVVLSLIQYNKDEILSLLKSKTYIILLLFFSLSTFSIIYSDNKSKAINDIVRLLPFLVIPLAVNKANINKETFITILKIFIYSCILSFFISIASQFYYKFIGQSFGFFNLNLTKFTWMHPTYLAWYLNVGLVIIYYLKFKLSALNNLFAIFTSLIFVVYIFMLSSRLQIITTIIILLFLLFYYTYSYKKTTKGFFILLAFIVGFYLLTTKVDYIKYRFIYAKNISYKITDVNYKAWNGFSVRLAIWSNSINIIKDNFFLGVGQGDANDCLINNYKEKGFLFAYNQKYNAHNQFFQTFISIGFIGFFILCLLFLYNLINGIRQNNFLLTSFTVISILTCLTESIFLMQGGVMFFILFLSVFQYKITSPSLAVSSKPLNL